MKHLISFLIIILLATSCKKTFDHPESCDDYDYYDCETIEPEVGKATFRFTINDKVWNVPFVIYKGSVEDNNVLFIDTARAESIVQYDLYFGTYSVKAKYVVDGKTIYVVDGGEMEKWSNDVCDSVCWSWDELDLDLRIK